MTLDARCDDDIDEDDLKQRLSKASGSNYSVHREVAKPQPAIKPVVCLISCVGTIKWWVCSNGGGSVVMGVCVVMGLCV